MISTKKNGSFTEYLPQSFSCRIVFLQSCVKIYFSASATAKIKWYIFTKKPENADNWKENPLNGPPEQDADSLGIQMWFKMIQKAKIVSKERMKPDSIVVSLLTNSE